MKDIRIVVDFPEVPGGRAQRRTFADPREIIEARTLAAVVPALARVAAAASAGMWCAGFLTYEAAPAFDAAMRVRAGGLMPLLWFGVFDAPIADQADEHAHALSRGDIAWRAGASDADNRAAIQTIQEAIRAGETYQVNYTTRLHGMYDGDARAWYEELRAAQGDGWHAFVRTPDYDILSASPELFFMRRGNRIETRPMKGTAPRGRWLEEDRARAEALRVSEKDRAENLMIVDLLRNDVGRIAVSGSVAVPSLYDVERYETVWQLTSRITGELREGVGLVDVFRALFPCGSVTGAPKINTMKWITQLESSPREVYCGAIGVIAPGGDCMFNVPIRTVTIERATGSAVYGVGSGITIDSSADGELAELRAKADVLQYRPTAFELLETMRIEHGVILRRALHVERAAKSAALFGFALDQKSLEAALSGEASGAEGDVRLRMRIAADGTVAFDRMPAPPRYLDRDACRRAGNIENVALSRAPVNGNDPFLCNKTTHRVVYAEQRAAAPGAFDVLMFNAASELTEFTNGNLVVDVDGSLLTPARSAGLLDGTFRRTLLEEGVIIESVLTVGDLARCSRYWLVNSVREWVEVALLH